jgi:hypothetical protein
VATFCVNARLPVIRMNSSSPIDAFYLKSGCDADERGPIVQAAVPRLHDARHQSSVLWGCLAGAEASSAVNRGYGEDAALTVDRCSRSYGGRCPGLADP